MKNFKKAVYLLLGGISLPLMACNFIGNPTTTTTTEAPKLSTATDPNKSSITNTQTSKSEYVITFIYGYNDLTSEATVKANEKLTKPTNPARTNYKFDNWYTDDTFTTIYDFNAAVNSDFNLYAKWNNIWTVSFSGAGNLASQKIVNNAKATKPTNPTKAGYEFDGWFKEETFEHEFDFESGVTSNLTLYAKFTKLWTVSFEGVSLNSINVRNNEVLTKPEDPVISGKKFEGWFSDEGLTTEFDFTTPITEDTTIYAKLSESLVVKFYDGETELSFVNLNSGDKVARPDDPTKSKYVFKGWYKEASLTNEFDFNDAITANTNVYAKWANLWDVTFDNTSLDVVTIENGNKVTKPADSLVTKTGYEFKGWYKESTFTTTFDFNDAITKDTHIYAKYTILSYTVSFDTRIETLVSSQTINYNEKATKPDETTLQNGDKQLVGWYLSDDEGVTLYTTSYDFNTPVTSSFKLYAKWVTPEITLTAEGGYNEGLFAEFTPTAGKSASNYTIKYKLHSASSYLTLDSELVRNIATNNIRFDIVGIAEGSYDYQILEGTNVLYTGENVSVIAHDRSGYAHFGYTNGVGAYKDDGTLKANAVVVYVTEANKNTVEAEINGSLKTGISAILKAATNEATPVVVRIIGRVAAATWNTPTYPVQNYYNSSTKKGVNPETAVKGNNGTYLALQNYEEEALTAGFNTLNESTYGKLKGLTNRIKYDSDKLEFDSYYNMLDINNAKNVTVEGIGADAEIFQWGFTWKSCYSIEVRNLTFTDYPEDACSFEGPSAKLSNKTTTEYDITTLFDGRIWLHNNTFNQGKNYWDVCSEQDKHDGDGSTDFKYTKNITLSYNHYDDTHKTGLVGGSESNLTACLTFHHNWYEKCKSRMPYARQANMHMYNNFYDDSTGTTMQIYAGAYAFIEGCYFYSDNKRFDLNAKNYTTPAVKSFNNTFDGGTAGSSVTVVTNRNQTVTNGNIFYLTDTNSVKQLYSSFDTNPLLFYYDSVNNKSDVTKLTDAATAKTDCETYSGAGYSWARSNS